jgi:hypothetical protein
MKKFSATFFGFSVNVIISTFLPSRVEEVFMPIHHHSCVLVCGAYYVLSVRGCQSLHSEVENIMPITADMPELLFCVLISKHGTANIIVFMHFERVSSLAQHNRSCSTARREIG